jgi:hypothetical protein
MHYIVLLRFEQSPLYRISLDAGERRWHIEKHARREHEPRFCKDWTLAPLRKVQTASNAMSHRESDGDYSD